MFISNLMSLLVVLDEWKLFEKSPKQFGMGGALLMKRDLTRFDKWPKTVQALSILRGHSFWARGPDNAGHYNSMPHEVVASIPHFRK